MKTALIMFPTEGVKRAEVMYASLLGLLKSEEFVHLCYWRSTQTDQTVDELNSDHKGFDFIGFSKWELLADYVADQMPDAVIIVSNRRFVWGLTRGLKLMNSDVWWVDNGGSVHEAKERLWSPLQAGEARSPA